MNYLGNTLEYLTAAASIASIYQSARLHVQTAKVDTDLHDEEMSLLREQQAQQIRTMKQTYLMNTFTDMERHFQQLNADLINGCKEFEKDMVDQRTIWCETIIVAGTIMLAALIAVLVQGVLPPGNNGMAVYLAYSISNAASLGFLSVSTILYVIVVYRISNFTIHRSSAHTHLILRAFKQTKQLLGGIRTDRASRQKHRKPPISDPPSNSTVSTGESYGRNHSQRTGFGLGPGVGMEQDRGGKPRDIEADLSPTTKVTVEHHTNISAMSEREFSSEWSEHEKLIHHFLDQRNKINNETADVFSEHNGFGVFWAQRCHNIATVGLYCFYIGTDLMLVAVMIFVWALYVSTYKCTVGAYVAVVILALSQVVGCAVLIVMKRHSSGGIVT